MAARIPAFVNPPVLTWAREEAGYSLEEAAALTRFPIEKLRSWEDGSTGANPTLRQAQALARHYHRPFGVFSLPQPPTIPPLATEYRRLPGIRPGVESPELRVAIRVMSQRRQTALQLSGELGAPVRERSTVIHLYEKPAEAGPRIRKLLGVTPQEQLEWPDDWKGWRRWRGAVEGIGALVFQFPKVGLDQVRGVSLLSFPLPAIGINSKESSAGARSFTLLHELVHISLARAQEEQVAQNEVRSEAEWREVERFAEEVASVILVPEEELAGFLARMSVPKDRWDLAAVRKLATTFRVTSLAMATRLRSLGAMTWDGYWQWRRQWDAYIATLKPRGGGFATPVEKALSRTGRPFAQLVLEAMDANRITAVDACRHLDLRFDYVQKLRVELLAGAGTGSTRRHKGE